MSQGSELPPATAALAPATPAETLALTPPLSGKAFDHIAYARVMLRIGLSARAAEALRRAVELGHDARSLSYEFARVALAGGDVSSAIRYLRVGLEVKKDEVPSHRPARHSAAAMRTLLVRVLLDTQAFRSASRELTGIDTSDWTELETASLDVERARVAAASDALDDIERLVREALRGGRVGDATKVLLGAVRQLAIRGRLDDAISLNERLLPDFEASAVSWQDHMTFTSKLRSAKVNFERGLAILERDRHARLVVAKTPIHSNQLPLPGSLEALEATALPAQLFLDMEQDGPQRSPLMSSEAQGLATKGLDELGWHGDRPRQRLSWHHWVSDVVLTETAPVFVTTAGQRMGAAPHDLGGVHEFAFISPGSKSRQIDLVFMAPPALTQNFGHALVDGLSSLAVYARLGMTCPLVVRGQLSPVLIQIAHAAGVPEDAEILQASELGDARIRRALFAQRAWGPQLSAWGDGLGQRLAGPDPEARERIVYVSRRGSWRRPLANEEELEDALVQRFGVEVVRFEDLELSEQARTVRHARVIVGPTGAGLASILFARPATALVELVPDRHANQFFFNLARELGSPHIPIAGTIIDLEKMSWKVDVETVLRAVAALAE